MLTASHVEHPRCAPFLRSLCCMAQALCAFHLCDTTICWCSSAYWFRFKSGILIDLMIHWSTLNGFFIETCQAKASVAITYSLSYSFIQPPDIPLKGHYLLMCFKLYWNFDIIDDLCFLEWRSESLKICNARLCCKGKCKKWKTTSIEIWYHS